MYPVVGFDCWPTCGRVDVEFDDDDEGITAGFDYRELLGMLYVVGFVIGLL